MSKLARKLQRAAQRAYAKTKHVAVGAVALGTSVVANAAANTNVMASVNSANDTFEEVKPIALAIAGTFLAIAIGYKAWKKLTRA